MPRALSLPMPRTRCGAQPAIPIPRPALPPGTGPRRKQPTSDLLPNVNSNTTPSTPTSLRTYIRCKKPRPALQKELPEHVLPPLPQPRPPRPHLRSPTAPHAGTHHAPDRRAHALLRLHRPRLPARLRTLPLGPHPGTRRRPDRRPPHPLREPRRSPPRAAPRRPPRTPPAALRPPQIRRDESDRSAELLQGGVAVDRYGARYPKADRLHPPTPEETEQMQQPTPAPEDPDPDQPSPSFPNPPERNRTPPTGTKSSRPPPKPKPLNPIPPEQNRTQPNRHPPQTLPRTALPPIPPKNQPHPNSNTPSTRSTDSSRTPSATETGSTTTPSTTPGTPNAKKPCAS